ncbi:type IX secretion system membrane protein PorP/SprF [Pontibacter sp. KCTC 32443]|uniref:PorP/SprF family type IX secretion system membrane protein n=1 Tax=Pontibacter TaxID=323449 RepID=UPI00164D56D9|nr:MULTISPECIES: type IX secretion system membrane protein PorP/SprF [Pontibacter]MBC5772969.1 type IX secretion system membrane protein PorP/SprF [Pontibacter sp. KCTC 32443]
MKKHILLLLILLTTLAASAQNRKYVGNFSQLRQFYNPSLTGQDGSQFKTLYRNQWTGYEDAPKTIFASAEFNLNDLKKSKGYQLNTTANDQEVLYGIGLLLLRESFGPYSETQVNVSYGSGVRLSDKYKLLWGSAITYTSLALDGNKLTVDQENDPKYSKVLGQNSRSGKMDLNLGITLSSENFYVGYSMKDVTQGKMVTSGEEFIADMYARKHIGTTGFRTGITEDVGIILNALYQYDKVTEGTIEGQLKAAYQNIFWVGGGYRNNLAFNVTSGLRLNKLQISYLYETPVADATTIDKPTNEITLAYLLKPRTNQAHNPRVLIW